MILPVLLPIQITVHYTPIFVSELSHVIVNSSVICIIISLIVVVANLVDYFINGYENECSAVVLIHVFFAVFVVFALLCIAGAMKRILACLKVGFILWVVVLVVWLTSCCIQFTSWYTVREICINNRCPESLWLSDFYYLGFEEVGDKFNNNSTAPANNSSLVKPENTTQKFEDPITRKKVPLQRNYLYITLFVLVFVSFFFFFIFLGSMVYSYHDALCYLDEEDHLVTVPHAAFIFIYPFRGYYEAGTSSNPEVEDNNKKEGATMDNQNINK